MIDLLCALLYAVDFELTGINQARKKISRGGAFARNAGRLPRRAYASTLACCLDNTSLNATTKSGTPGERRGVSPTWERV